MSTPRDDSEACAARDVDAAFLGIYLRAVASIAAVSTAGFAGGVTLIAAIVVGELGHPQWPVRAGCLLVLAMIVHRIVCNGGRWIGSSFAGESAAQPRAVWQRLGMVDLPVVGAALFGAAVILPWSTAIVVVAIAEGAVLLPVLRHRQLADAHHMTTMFPMDWSGARRSR